MRNTPMSVPVLLLVLGVGASAHAAEPARLPPVVVPAEQAATSPAVTAPAAVTRLEANALREAGVASLTDLPAAVPNLSLSHSTAPAFGDIYAVRGIANTEFFSDPALIVYVDDAPAGDAMSNPGDLPELAGAEIWRGPQGSRFGKNAAGGVIDLTTARPTDTWTGFGRLSLASRDTARYQAGVQGPLVPGELRLGVSGGYGRSDGFIENTLRGGRVDASERSAGRLFLGWIPAPDWDIGLTLTADRFEGGAQLAPVSGPFAEVASDVDQQADAESSGQALRLRRVLPGAILTAVTTRRDYSLDPLLLDIDQSPAPGNTALIQHDETFWSQELRLQSPDDMADWRWRGGVFVSATERDGDDTRDFIAPVAPGVYLPISQRTVFALDDEDYALFGLVTYGGVDRLGLTLGGRLDYAVRSIERTKTGTPPVPWPAVDDEETYFTAAPEAALDYELDPGLRLYARTVLGFKPGGFSAYVDAPRSPAFDTERNWASEAGVKSEWLEKKLQANLAVFHHDIRDYQVEHNLIGGTDRTVLNAPAVTARGVEGELVARVGGGLELSAGAGFTDIEFDEFADADTGVSLAGKRPPYVPEFDARLAAHYRAACGGFLRVEYQRVGRTYFDEANRAELTEAGYGLVNARIGYETARYQVCVFGQNLTDEEYFTRRLVLADVAGVPGEPLTMGVQVGCTF